MGVSADRQCGGEESGGEHLGGEDLMIQNYATTSLNLITETNAAITEYEEESQRAGARYR